MKRATESAPPKGRVNDLVDGRPMWVLPAIIIGGVIFLWVSVEILTKSSPEFKAISWHLRHGDQITVKGVTFPVYLWYAPKEFSDQFSVDYEPGPLRRYFSEADTTPTFFSINGWKDKTDVGTPQELVQTQLNNYAKAGYRGLTKLQINLRSQTLDCMQQHNDEDAPSGWTIYCYGEGPFYSVFFTGSTESFERFKQTISQAK